MGKRRIVLPGKGPPCPRCHKLMQIREHKTIRAKQLAQPFYYSRWYCCMSGKCKTKQVMPEEFKVFPVEIEDAPDEFEAILASEVLPWD